MDYSPTLQSISVFLTAYDAALFYKNKNPKIYILNCIFHQWMAGNIASNSHIILM